ncbi:MAG TPA: hypothetical protein PK916_11965 [Bacteroidota bacterium]|nr:hypothetical protein [Bacteroidota bacterium]
MSAFHRIPVIVTLFLLAATLGAQTRTITFSGKEDGGTRTVVPDSIRIRNVTKGVDTLLVARTVFDIDWLTGVDAQGRALDGFTLDVGPDRAGGGGSVVVSLPLSGTLRLSAFSILGAEVASTTVTLGPGRYSFRFDATGIASGTYFISAAIGRETRTTKLQVFRASSAGTPRLQFEGTAPAPMGKAVADRYTFIGYARGFHPDTLANIEPVAGRDYPFSFTPLPSNELVIGAPREVASGTVTSQGGTIKVVGAGTPLTGLEIVVPKQAFTDARSFTVSYSPILNHGFDDKVKVLSPLITISNGGGYADSVMLVKIPIQLPPGYFAMAFFIDRDTRTLEGIPIMALNDDAVYIASKHFSIDHLGMAKSSLRKVARNWADVLVLGVRTGDLAGTITSTFTPGVDDWEFINFGSYLAPGGHCTGQSLTAIWYFLNKKQRFNAPPLFNQMDEVHVDSMWMDNVRGYRFASVVWKGLAWNSRSNWRRNHFQPVGTSKISMDSLHYLAFAFSIQNTGLPQLTEIWRQAGREWFGHAMIVYGVDSGKVLIADPNFPGKVRGTQLELGRFKPYSSAEKAGEPGEQYPEIHYIANSAIVPVGLIEDRWRETFAGSIGTVPPNTFPETELFLKSGESSTALPDIVETTTNDVLVYATCGSCAATYDGERTPIRLTDENGNFIAWTDGTGMLRIPAKAGSTRYGLTIYGFTKSDFTESGYITFRWLTVKRKTFVAASVNSGPLQGHYRNEDRTSGQLVVTYSDEPVVITYLDTGYEIGVYGTYSGNVYRFDTTYIKGGNTFTDRITIELDSSMGMVKNYTIQRIYIQPGSWTDDITIKGQNIPLEANGNTEEYQRYLFTGEEVCKHITSVVYTFRRLDRDYTQTLESFTCRPNTKIQIVLTKR